MSQRRRRASANIRAPEAPAPRSSGALPIPNVVPGCKMRVIDDSSASEAPRWVTLESSLIYSPYAINEALKRHKLEFAWVRFAGSDEYWQRGASGERLAKHA